MTQLEADQNRYVVYLRDSFNPNRSSNATDSLAARTRSRRGARRKSPSPSTWEWSDSSWEEGHLDEILDSLLALETNSTATTTPSAAPTAVSSEFRHKHRPHSQGRSRPRHHHYRKHNRHKSREGSGRLPEWRADRDTGDMKRPFVFSDREVLRLRWSAEMGSKSRQSRERLQAGALLDEKAVRKERRWWTIPFSYAFGSTKSR